VGRYGRAHENYSTRSNVVATFVQQYYVAVAKPPSKPAEFFARHVRLSDVKSQTRQAPQVPNPAVYINSVTYGRVAYVFVSSTENIEKLRAAVDASFNGLLASGHFGGSQEQQAIVQHAESKIFVLGGDSAAGSRLTAGGIAALPDWINTGGTFSKDSPGAPIAFSTRYLRSDFRISGIAFYTDYSKPTCVNTPEQIVSVSRSYAIGDDKDRGNAHRFSVFRGNQILAQENWSGADIWWRTSPPNYDGPALVINVPVSGCSTLRFRTEQDGQHGKTTGRAWVIGVTDAGRRLALVNGQSFSVEDTAFFDYMTECNTFLQKNVFPDL
jgi:hypothetical protein